MRSSAMKRRRSGTVSSIALSASRKPIITAIAVNSEVDWRFGPVATFSRRSSSSAGRRSRCSVAAKRASSADTVPCPPRAGRIRIPLTLPRMPTMPCATPSTATATGLAEAPATEPPSSTRMRALCTTPPLATRSVSPGWAFSALATPLGRPMPPLSSTVAAPSSCVATPPSASMLGVTPISCTACWPCRALSVTFSRSTGAATCTPSISPTFATSDSLNPCEERATSS